MNFFRHSIFALVLAAIPVVATAGCGARVEIDDGVTQQVEASISSATLADDCPAGTTGSASAGSGSARGGAPAESSADSGTGFADSSYCRQSNMQLALSADVAGAKIVVSRVYLLDAATGDTLTEVKTRNPGVWATGKYISWDGTLASGASKVSYDLGSVNWGALPGSASRYSGYGRLFKLQVVLSVNGQERTLTSGELSREPEVAT